MRLHSALLILALVGLTAGCVLGPGTVIRDRFDYITVPEEHIAERRVSPTAAAEEGPAGPIRPLIQIKSSRDRPADAFVAVPYRDFWFWIDDRDVPSKRMLSFIMFVFALVEPRSKDARRCSRSPPADAMRARLHTSRR